MDKKLITLEQDQRFSKSIVWHAQRAYYHELGIEAWAGDVPFYITSNPYIASCYAHLVIRFIQDWIRRHPGSEQAPFYVMEMGAGSGQFSFYVVKQLHYLQQQLGLEAIQIRYVMTDYAQKNVDFWRSHPALTPFLDNGMLDFAIYDVEQTEPIQLLVSNVALEPQSLANPLTVFANYLFDSIVNDVFSVRDQKLYESLLSCRVTPDNVEDNGDPRDWEKAKYSYQDRDINLPYYNEKVFDDILADYAKQFEDTTFLFPIGSLQCLQNLEKLSQSGLLLLTSDKGYLTLDELDHCEYPEFDFHGSFSVMVNYDAIARYFKRVGGDAFLTTPRDGLATAIFSSGFELDDLSETMLQIHERFERFSPSDFFNSYDNLEHTLEQTQLPTLISLLALSNWDPFIYAEIADAIDQQLDDAEEQLVDYLSAKLPNVAEQFYFIPGTEDILFQIAVFYQNYENYAAALKYFEGSECYFNGNYALYFNRGVCYFYLENYEAAQQAFAKALEYELKDEEALQWLAKVGEQLRGHDSD